MHTGMPRSSDGAARPCRRAQRASCMDLAQTNPPRRGEGSSVMGPSNSSPAGPARQGQGTAFPRPARQRPGNMKHIPAVGIWACSCQTQPVCGLGAAGQGQGRPVESGRWASLALQPQAWLLRATIVSRKCALGGWCPCGVERNFGTGGGMGGGSIACTFVFPTQAKGKPQNYHQATLILAWWHQSAKSHFWKMLSFST